MSANLHEQVPRERGERNQERERSRTQQRRQHASATHKSNFSVLSTLAEIADAAQFDRQHSSSTILALVRPNFFKSNTNVGRFRSTINRSARIREWSSRVVRPASGSSSTSPPTVTLAPLTRRNARCAAALPKVRDRCLQSDGKRLRPTTGT